MGRVEEVGDKEVSVEVMVDGMVGGVGEVG